MKKVFTTCACLLLGISVAGATDYHFDATGGDDTAAGTSPDQAWRSLEKRAAFP